MIKKYLSICLFCIAFLAQSQNINFTNASLKSHLLIAASVPTAFHYAKDLDGNFTNIDTNSNGEIEVSEALNISWLDVSNSNTDNLVGIEYFTNLKTFHCSNNPRLTSFGTVLDVMPLLEHLIFTQSQISYVNTALHPGLLSLTASENRLLASIDLTPLHLLEYLYLQENQILESVDVSACPNLQQFWLYQCPNLRVLNIKNGVYDSDNYRFSSCGNLKYICCDEVELTRVSYHAMVWAASDCQVNTYCTTVPGGEYYVINGSEKIDVNNNSCELSDAFYPRLKIRLSNAPTHEVFFGDETGHHNFWVGSGTYTLRPVLENPTYFTISPASATVSFPEAASPATRNFCVKPNGTHPDLEVLMIPLQPARPGFDCKYKIIYKNNGNIMQSGTVNLTFNSSILTVQSISPAAASLNGNMISWNFSDLVPFESRELTLVLKVNSPVQTPPVNIGDLISYTCTIVSPATDNTPLDNTALLSQIAVGAYDPNDKKCLEGKTISPTQAGGYVHYIIRFENTGNYAAENVIVVDDINATQFSIESLIPLSGSHPYTTRIAGNKVEFIFKNINLPFDDANNDGYVAFKIKTKPTLVLGDSFSNSASIYFDYNFPIVTDPAVTTIAILETKDFEFSDYFSLYPNPVNTILNIESKKGIKISSVSIYNVLGQLVLVHTNLNQSKSIDVSSLKSGNYFIKVNSDKGISNAKFIKQ